MEACWAHNPEVRRSKLRSANKFWFNGKIHCSNLNGFGYIPIWSNHFAIIFITVRMAEWSKAPDSRLILTPLIGSTSENSGPRMRAWVQIPLLTTIFSSSLFAVTCWLVLCCQNSQCASVAQ